MGSTMYFLGLLCLIIGANGYLNPFEELRSEFELSETGTNLVNPGYRLDDSVYPTNMTVSLDVYLAASLFFGRVSMIVEVRQTNVSTIVFHQKVVSIQSVSVYNASDNSPVPLQFPNPFETDDYLEIIKVNLEEAAPLGRYIINVEYMGRINTNPIDRGFYKGYYFQNQIQRREYATTQFQPFHARKAFPCFDEPQFKSQYTISITRGSDLGPSFSNMDIARTIQIGNRVTEHFHPTPIISAYLVAFHVSDFVGTNHTSLDPRPFQIISRREALDQHEYAADIGQRITTELDDYLGIQYHDMGQGILMKNDHIALPDFPSGAMENWGMVNYREAYLLYDPQNTNLINKIFIATIMAHELAHKWFGNLVTCFWWSNLWLNESFASFFERFGAHYADPSLELSDQFVTGAVFGALNGDASPTIVPMNWVEVANQSTISGHFGTSSYDKGASVLRMLEHFVGERTFRNALRYYLRDNAYDIGTADDMYNAFRRATSEDREFLRLYPNVEIGAVFDSWVQNPGAPVLEVNYNLNTSVISLRQERFVLSGNPAAQVWHIPITWTHSGELNFSSTKPSLVLSQPTATITNVPLGNDDDFVIFNIAHSGFYRVNYNERNWRNIATFLRSNNRERIHKLTRAQIVNDVLFYVRSGRLDIELAFDVISFLANETDYYVWVGAVNQFDWILRRLEHMPAAHSIFSRYILILLDAAINELGYNESPNDSTSVILNRIQILNLACNLGHEGCISDSVQKWDNFRNNGTAVPPNLRRHVYCVGLREGAISDYNFLYERYNSSQNTADMVVILRALACTKNESSIDHYLTQSMYNTKIRMHDKTNAFSFALQGNPENRRIVYNYLQTNFVRMRQFYGGPARLNIAINSCTAFLTDFDDIQQFQQWAHTNQLALADSFNTARGIPPIAISNLQWGGNNAENLVEAVLPIVSRSSAVTFSASFALLLVAFMMRFMY